MTIQAILASTYYGGGGGPTVEGEFLYNGNYVPYGYYGPDQNGPIYEANVNFASTNSTGNQHVFSGDSYMLTSALFGITSSFYMNLWFYPQGAGTIVATIQGTVIENTAYHHTLLEINNSSQPVIGFYPQHPNGGGSGGLVLTDTVNYNTWNHIYLFNNGSITSACLNGGATQTVSAVWLSNAPGDHYIGFGTQSVTNLGSTNRFIGRIGQFECSSSFMASNYAITKAGFQPEIRLDLDAAVNPAYTLEEYVLADASASGGYGANNIAFFSQASDITQGFLFNVGVGWTVENESAWSATVIGRGAFGNPGAVQIDTGWQLGPYTFKPPVNVWRSTNETYRYLTLLNTPTYTEGPPAYFSFDAASLEYGTASNLGDLNRWTVEVWFRVTSSLNGYTMMIVGNQYDGGTRLNFSIGTNSSPNTYNINTGFFDGAWRTAGSLNPTLNTWYHVVGTYDGNYVRQYVNGFLDGETAYVGTPQSGGQVYVAKRWDLGAVTDHFPGDIGQVTIYAGALTESEVSQLWYATRSTYGL